MFLLVRIQAVFPLAKVNAITPAITQATATVFVLGLAHDTDRIVSIYVAMPKVAKASTI